MIIEEMKAHILGIDPFVLGDYALEDEYRKWIFSLSRYMLAPYPEYLSDHMDFVTIYAIKKLENQISFFKDKKITSNKFLLMDHYLFSTISLEAVRIMVDIHTDKPKDFTTRHNSIVIAMEEILEEIKNELLVDLPTGYINTDGNGLQSPMEFKNSYPSKSEPNKSFFAFMDKVVRKIRNKDEYVIKHIRDFIIEAETLVI